jgi:transposase
MIPVWLASGVTDMHKGMNGLSLQVQEGLGLSLYAKRLERGRFIWPSPTDGVVAIRPAQIGYMLEGIDWRHPPSVAG